MKDLLKIMLEASCRDGAVVEFTRESNRIEGIGREPRTREVKAHVHFLGLNVIKTPDLIELVARLQPGARLRDQPGLDVRVGDHLPPRGGPEVREELQRLLIDVDDGEHAYTTHRRYETLHPFTDGNGRSGRALWLWQMMHQSSDQHALRRGFLHTFYYQALGAARG